MPKSARKVAARVRTPTHTTLVIEESRADRWVKWGWRFGVALAAVGGALWWVFGYYAAFEEVKKAVGHVDPPSGLIKSVRDLADHQRANAEALSRIEQSIQKVAKSHER